MTKRVRRGLTIAAAGTPRQRGDTWTVPSQSGTRSYRVTVGEGWSTCTCPDTSFRGVTCKHVYAVAILLAVEAASA